MPPHQPCTVYVTQSITSHLPSCKLFLDTSCVSCFQPEYNSFSKVPRCTQISWLNWGPSSPFAWTTWDRVGGSGWSLLNVPMLIECCHQFGVISRALRLISCGSKTPVEISTTKTTCRLTLAHILCKLASACTPRLQFDYAIWSIGGKRGVWKNDMSISVCGCTATRWTMI